MEQRIVGQPHALDAVAQAIRTSRAGLTDPRKPIGVFLMVGTSGIGKTETALTLADLLYGGEQNMTVINMSEFKEEHKVSLLMGSPPGYVGYGEGGVLTEAVRRRPYSVILLDEMEKAHPGVQDIFFQVFDKGNMKDGEGRDIDFKNTVIIMTSNAGTDLITRLFADPETAPDAGGAGRCADAGADEALQAGVPRAGESGPVFSALAGHHPADRRAAARSDPAKSAGILWRQVRLGPGTGRHDRRTLHRDIVRSAQRGEDPLADVTAGTVRGGAISPRRGRNDQRGHRGRGHGWVVSIPHRLNPSNRLAGNKGAHRGNLHEVGTIDGAVTTTGFEKWIELSSFQWGVGRAIGTAARGAATREASEPSISEIVVTKRLDKSSTKLFMDAVAGDLSATVKFKFTTTTKDKIDTFLAYELTNCGLSGYSISSGGDAPSESLSLNFTKVMFTYTERDPKVAGSPDTVGYDLLTMAKV